MDESTPPACPTAGESPESVRYPAQPGPGRASQQDVGVGPAQQTDNPTTDPGTSSAPTGHADLEVALSPTEEPEPEKPSAAEPAVTVADLEEIHDQLLGLAGHLESFDRLGGQVAELVRLRGRDTDLIEKLHADNSRLRQGEVVTATAPLISGLVRLHDQMANLAGGDPTSDAELLRRQLLQLLDTASGITADDPQPGDTFDYSRHSGAGKVDTADPAADGTIARTVRVGFARSDGSVVRVPEVEVYRHVPEPSTSAAKAPDDTPATPTTAVQTTAEPSSNADPDAPTRATSTPFTPDPQERP